MSAVIPLSKIVADAADDIGPLPRPLQASLNVTGRCNSLCQYCSYGDPETMKRQDISYEQVAEQIENFTALGVKSLSISGGEPMLRKDIYDLIRFATSLGMVTTMITNGTLLNLASAKKLHDAGLVTLVLSLDSLREDLYQEIRGIPINKPRLAFQELQTFRRGTSCIPRLVVNIVLTRLVANDLCTHVKTLTPMLLEQDLIMVQAYQPPPNLPAKKDGFRFSPSDLPHLESLIDSLIALQEQGIPIGNDVTFLKRLPGFLVTGQLPDNYRCTIGYSTLYIKENFDVHPCWQLPPVGNLNDMAIDQLWHSPEYAAARERMKALDCRKCALVCHAPEFLDTLSELVGHEPL